MEENIEEKKEIEKKENKEAPEQSLKLKLEECEKKKDEDLAGWQRARADFINYRKEEMERIEEILKYAGEEMVLKILPILDNFELVENSLAPELKENENVKGMLQLKNQIKDFLKQNGAEEIKSEGEKFDPNLHEALETVGGEESGVITEVIQKGYKI